METRVAVMSIIVEQSDSVETLNSILHEYSRYIIGRMGIPYRQKNISILSSLHDLNQALSFGDKFFFLKNGVIDCQGRENIVTPTVIKNTFDIDVRIVEIENQKIIIGGNHK